MQKGGQKAPHSPPACDVRTYIHFLLTAKSAAISGCFSNDRCTDTSKEISSTSSTVFLSSSLSSASPPRHSVRTESGIPPFVSSGPFSTEQLPHYNQPCSQSQRHIPAKGTEGNEHVRGSSSPPQCFACRSASLLRLCADARRWWTESGPQVAPHVSDSAPASPSDLFRSVESFCLPSNVTTDCIGRTNFLLQRPPPEALNPTTNERKRKEKMFWNLVCLAWQRSLVSLHEACTITIGTLLPSVQNW